MASETYQGAVLSRPLFCLPVFWPFFHLLTYRARVKQDERDLNMAFAPKLKTKRVITKYSIGGAIFALVSLASAIVFLIGCMAPGTRDLAIYRVDVANLADELLKLASGNENDNRTKSDLLHPDLPQYWFYGQSGICDFYTDSPRLSAKGETTCRYGFPPDQRVLSVVEGSIRSGLGRNSSVGGTPENRETVVTAVVEAWREVLDAVPGEKLRDKEGKVEAQNKASCALAILAVMIEVVAYGLVYVLGEVRAGRAVAYLVAGCSGVFAIAAGACAILSMNEGMHGVISGVGNVSGSLLFLFIGAVLKLPAVTGLLPRQVKLSHVVVGELGENFVFDWCRERIPDFSSTEHWSSRIYPLSEQGKYADFTYVDHEGYMTEALRGAGVPLMAGWSRGTKYHLEVKSTQGECTDAPFIVSQSQIDTKVSLEVKYVVEAGNANASAVDEGVQ
ncbi:hypothetical protein B0T16DRAFT_221792 [Cercophora newfieldiana]|uniref:Uncharacterized protein n=1 Tax=Cercophora newfieldiana TaxID=92897 RepID=A0AA39XX50_9PEZI|nr:hypothetical protein B0T16DRAFT_221792 [Cercophora newfieldiana]